MRAHRRLVLTATLWLVASPCAAQTPGTTPLTAGLSDGPDELSSPLGPVHGAGSPALQQHTELLLFAPETVLTPWTVALQVELAERGTTVVPRSTASAPPNAEAHTDAVVVEASADAYEVRLLSLDGANVEVQTPREIDPRTAALIIVSLLDEPSHATGREDARPPTADHAPERAAEPGPAAFDGPSALTEPGPAVEWSGLVGTGGYALANEQHIFPGTVVRGGLGLRYDHLELAFLTDFGVMVEELPGEFFLDERRALQTMLRVCLEGGFRIPIDAVGLHAGLRGCTGYGEQHARIPDVSFGGPAAFVDRFGALLSAGGYMAVSLGLTESIRLLARAEFGVVAREGSELQFIPAASTLLSFRVP